MANFRDLTTTKLDGIFEVYARNVKTGKTEKIEEANLVVAQARTLMRDLVVGGNTSITKIQIGDMNKSLGDDISDLGDPSYGDTELENSFFDKAYASREAITYDDRPAIKYKFVIEEDEANDSDNDDYERKLWCEYGLINNDGKIWNRKIKPIIKDNETEITIYWTLIF